MQALEPFPGGRVGVGRRIDPRPVVGDRAERVRRLVAHRLCHAYRRPQRGGEDDAEHHRLGSQLAHPEGSPSPPRTGLATAAVTAVVATAPARHSAARGPWRRGVSAKCSGRRLLLSKRPRSSLPRGSGRGGRAASAACRSRAPGGWRPCRPGGRGSERLPGGSSPSRSQSTTGPRNEPGSWLSSSSSGTAQFVKILLRRRVGFRFAHEIHSSLPCQPSGLEQLEFPETFSPPRHTASWPGARNARSRGPCAGPGRWPGTRRRRRLDRTGPSSEHQYHRPMPLDHGREGVLGLLAPRGEEPVQSAGISQAADRPAPQPASRGLEPSRTAGPLAMSRLLPWQAFFLSPTLGDTGISRKNASLEAEEMTAWWAPQAGGILGRGRSGRIRHQDHEWGWLTVAAPGWRPGIPGLHVTGRTAGRGRRCGARRP